MRLMGVVGVVLAVLSMYCCLVAAVSFDLHPDTKICLKQEVRKEDVIGGKVVIGPQVGNVKTELSIKITDLVDHLVFSRNGVKGEGNDNTVNFLSTSTRDDVYQICFENIVYHRDSVNTGPMDGVREITLNVKMGSDNNNYDELAKKQNLKPMEVELKRIEDESLAILHTFQFLKKREEEMRDTNESTNARVLWFSILSMGCLVALGSWQVYYLKNFFQQKKLI